MSSKAHFPLLAKRAAAFRRKSRSHRYVFIFPPQRGQLPRALARERALRVAPPVDGRLSQPKRAPPSPCRSVPGATCPMLLPLARTARLPQPCTRGELRRLPSFHGPSLHHIGVSTIGRLRPLLAPTYFAAGSDWPSPAQRRNHDQAQPSGPISDVGGSVEPTKAIHERLLEGGVVGKPHGLQRERLARRA